MRDTPRRGIRRRRVTEILRLCAPAPDSPDVPQSLSAAFRALRPPKVTAEQKSGVAGMLLLDGEAAHGPVELIEVPIRFLAIRSR